MKNSRILIWVGVLSVSIALALTAASSKSPDRSGAVAVETTLAHPVMLAGAKQTTYLKVAVTGVDMNPDKRAPVNVAIVLDRSGSMSGKKIEQARRAAIAAIDQLRPDDIVSVVTYSSNVNVLIPATKVSDRESLYMRIRGIASGGNTALFAGVSKGAQELRKFIDENRVSSVVLLSDGLANVGPSSPGDLAALGATLGAEGITVTTVGLGLDFNEDLMAGLALKSEGNHFFVEDATDLTLAFATEFGDAISATAQDAHIVIDCPAGVRPVRMLGREADIRGQRVEVYLNQVYQEQTKYVLLEVEIAAGSAGRRIPAAAVTVTYRDLDRGGMRTARSSASVRFTNAAAEQKSNEHRETMISAVKLIAVENNKIAVALRDQGKIEAARRAFLENETYSLDNSAKYNSSELLTYGVTQGGAARVVDTPKWKAERKLQIEQNLKTTSQRAVTPKTEGSDKD